MTGTSALQRADHAEPHAIVDGINPIDLVAVLGQEGFHDGLRAFPVPFRRLAVKHADTRIGICNRVEEAVAAQDRHGVARRAFDHHDIAFAIQRIGQHVGGLLRLQAVIGAGMANDVAPRLNTL